MTDIFGLEIENVPASYTPLDATALVKCLDDDGNLTLVVRSTETLQSWELVGILQCGLDLSRDFARESFRSVDDEPEDEEAA
jgi:hypothetical protein